MLAIRKETLKVVNPDTGKYEGIAAISGDKGESSYEVAVRNGFTGTEADFLDQFVPDEILTSFQSFKADNEDMKSRLTSIEDTVSNLDIPDNSAEVSALQTDVSGLSDRVTAVETLNTTQSNTIGSHTTSISNLTSRMSTAESNISNHGSRLTTAETKLNNIPATLFTVANNAGAHNSIYRGKDLTGVYTVTDIVNMIANANFNDLFIGDYITVSVSTSYLSNESITFIIAKFVEYEDTNGGISGNKLILLPKDCLYKFYYNSSNSFTNEGVRSEINQIFNTYNESLQTLFNTTVVAKLMLDVALTAESIGNATCYERYLKIGGTYDVLHEQGEMFPLFRFNPSCRAARYANNGLVNYIIGSDGTAEMNSTSRTSYKAYYSSNGIMDNVSLNKTNIYLRPFFLIG